MAVISTARVGAVSVVDKAGRPVPLYAAITMGKRLVVVSDCPIHPKYQALRPPRSEKPGCKCAEIWNQQGERF